MACHIRIQNCRSDLVSLIDVSRQLVGRVAEWLSHQIHDLTAAGGIPTKAYAAIDLG